MKRLFLAIALMAFGFAPVQAKDVSEWSATAGNNNDASPDGAPENMAPSGVNDTIREIMAATKRWYDGLYSHNHLINGGFRVAQRGSSFTSASAPANNDDTFLLDRWLLLSDGNDIVDVSQETSTVPTGAYAAIKLDVETANKKFGIAQILEKRDAMKLIGGSVSLSFKARINGSTIGAIRAGVACWASTADSVTSDLVSAWGVAGTNPTLATNWTFENTPAALTAPTTSYQTYTIEDIDLDTSSCVNVAVFIWTDDETTSTGDFLYIADVQLQAGTVATQFASRPFADELAAAKRYYERYTYNAVGDQIIAYGTVDATSEIEGPLYYSEKRVAPSFTTTAAGTFALQEYGIGANAATSVTIAQITPRQARIQAGYGGAAYTVGNGGAVKRDATDTTYIEISAEM